MNVLSMDIKVDKLPDGCNVRDRNDEGCVFNQHKYCVLKLAANQGGFFVQNNRGIIPDDCPLKQIK